MLAVSTPIAPTWRSLTRTRGVRAVREELVATASSPARAAERTYVAEIDQAARRVRAVRGKVQVVRRTGRVVAEIGLAVAVARAPAGAQQHDPSGFDAARRARPVGDRG